MPPQDTDSAAAQEKPEEKQQKILHLVLEHIDYLQEYKMFQAICFQTDHKNLNMFEIYDIVKFSF